MSIPLFPHSLIYSTYAGYTYDEKIHIAVNFSSLNKSKLTDSPLPTNPHRTHPSPHRHAIQPAKLASDPSSAPSALSSVIKPWNGSERADNVDTGNGKEWNGVVGESELEKILGWRGGMGREGEEERRGVTFGLVVSGLGKVVFLPVETMIVPGSGR